MMNKSVKKMYDEIHNQTFASVICALGLCKPCEHAKQKLNVFIITLIIHQELQGVSCQSIL